MCESQSHSDSHTNIAPHINIDGFVRECTTVKGLTNYTEAFIDFLFLFDQRREKHSITFKTKPVLNELKCNRMSAADWCAYYLKIKIILSSFHHVYLSLSFFFVFVCFYILSFFCKR